MLPPFRPAKSTKSNARAGRHAAGAFQEFDQHTTVTAYQSQILRLRRKLIVDIIQEGFPVVPGSQILDYGRRQQYLPIGATLYFVPRDESLEKAPHESEALFFSS